MTCAAAFGWGAGAQHQHGQGKHHKYEMDVAAVDLLNGQGEECEFVFHHDYPLVEFDAPTIAGLGLQSRLQKIKKREQPRAVLFWRCA
jgi:hypothetical protein